MASITGNRSKLHAGHILVSHLGVAVLGAMVGFFIGMFAGTRNKSAVPVTLFVAPAK